MNVINGVGKHFKLLKIDVNFSFCAITDPIIRIFNDKYRPYPISKQINMYECNCAFSLHRFIHLCYVIILFEVLFNWTYISESHTLFICLESPSISWNFIIELIDDDMNNWVFYISSQVKHLCYSGWIHRHISIIDMCIFWWTIFRVCCPHQMR